MPKIFRSPAKSKMNFSIPCLILILLAAQTQAQAQGRAPAATKVLNLSPQGSVKKVQQVIAKFSADMVAMGDFNLNSAAKTTTPTTNDSTTETQDNPQDPFSIQCNEEPLPQHRTRWADSKTWVLDFQSPLPAGWRCELKLKKKTKDRLGQTVTAGQSEYIFSTSGPAILELMPSEGQIEPDQHFVILTDGGLDSESILKHAFFEIQGMPGRNNAKILEGPQRNEILEAAFNGNWEWNQYKDRKDLDRFIVLGADRRFPETAKVALHWTKGVRSKSGINVTEPQLYQFEVIDAFKAKFSCERTAADRACNPILPMQLNFSKPVVAKQLKGAKLVDAAGKAWLPKTRNSQNFDQESGQESGQDSGEESEEHISHLSFYGPFPPETKFKLQLPEKIVDELGRPLANADQFPLEVSTDEYSPLVKFAAPFGILELNADPILPLSLRNVEKELGTQQLSIEGKSFSLTSQASFNQVIELLQKTLRKNWDTEKRSQPLLGTSEGVQFKVTKPSSEKDFELIGIPLKKPGFYLVEVQSPKLGEVLLEKSSMYVASAALVTDLSVHFKKGRESSLVWVTSLATANPVGKAQVSIVNSLGREIVKGITNEEGIFRFGKVDYPCQADENSSDGGTTNGTTNGTNNGTNTTSTPGETPTCEVYAFAKKGDDFSFVSSQWSEGIEAYRFNLPMEYLNRQWGPIALTTILDRVTVQRGERVQMKHILRDYELNGFRSMNSAKLPRRVLAVHQGSQKTYSLPFEYDSKTGSAQGQFNIPKDATLGRYNIYLSNQLQTNAEEAFDWTAEETAHFIVSEYRLPLMSATVKVNESPLVQPKEVKVDLSAHYLSGGPAKNLKVKIRTSLIPGSFEPEIPGKNEFNFFAEPLKTGLLSREEETQEPESFLTEQTLQLGATGGAVLSLKGIPRIRGVKNLLIEMEYLDPNGEVRTAATRVPVFPSQTVIGLKSEGWGFESGKSKIIGVITNQLGKVQKAKSYSIEAFRMRYITHRKRLVGGFYSYDSKTEVVSLGQVCQGQSDLIGRFTCQPKQLPAGSVILQAKTSDEQGRATYSRIGLSVFKEGSESWWVPSDSDRIDLIPEKVSYEPEDTARLMVRSPYTKAMALVTVEREGILEASVQEVRRDQPMIDVPLKGIYAPNVFVSVLLQRGRISGPKPTALVDLGKPALKMGMAEIKVGWKTHELKVLVTTDKKKYQVRSRVLAKIKVNPATAEALKNPSEVAFAVVDEALLRLKENETWNLLKNMMGQRTLAVSTSSALSQVIGRRHFGSKAKPAGGGGGNLSADLRELFDPILYWNPKVTLNEAGEAEVEFTLNDSLTQFRIVAIATSGSALFGSGEARIEASKDLIIYSGFAPSVREGDNLLNRLTLRNTTEQEMKVQLDITSKEVRDLPKLEPLVLKASEARTLDLPMKVPSGLETITFQISAIDQISKFRDDLSISAKVKPAVPVQVLQASMVQLEGQTEKISYLQPKASLPGKGGLKLSTQASLRSGLNEVKAYLNTYPYSCLEQKVSRAIVLENQKELQNLIEDLPSYMDSSGVLKFFATTSCGSPQLTRYVLNVLKANEFQLPESTSLKILDGLEAVVRGTYNCRSWWDSESSNQTVLASGYPTEGRLLIMQTLASFGRFQAEWLSTLQVTPNLWRNETLAAWHQLLKLRPEIPESAKLLEQANQIIRARLNFQGSLMNLQNESDWEARYRLFTSQDQEALGIFGLSLEEESFRSDTGRMARGVVARLRKGKWDTTMANAWGVTYMKKFGKKFEAEAPSGMTEAVIQTAGAGSSRRTEVWKWSEAPQGSEKMIDWPNTPQNVTTASEAQVSHRGRGKPWLQYSILAAVPLKVPLNYGYRITRKVTPVLSAVPGAWSVGDVAEIEITIIAEADQPWVVVRDPIPAGAAHLGTGLSGTSGILERKQLAKQQSGLTTTEFWPSEFDEKSQSDFISYAGYLSRGTYKTSYRIRLNSSGEFNLPPTRVEAMYSPESFGEVPNAVWIVKP